VAKAIVVRKSAARKGVRVRLPAIPKFTLILRAFSPPQTLFSNRAKSPMASVNAVGEAGATLFRFVLLERKCDCGLRSECGALCH
jgi:hypothetical protein